MPVDEIATDLRFSLLEEIERDLNDAVNDQLVREIELKVPLDTGQLMSSIEVDDWQLSGTTYVTTVRAKEPYARYTDEGTGIYAGQGRIYPRQASALVFYWRQMGEVVAFKSVAGQPAQRWFQEPMPLYFDRALETMSR